MERTDILHDLSVQIEALARFHIQHGLGQTEGVDRHRRNIKDIVRVHEIDVQRELDPISQYYYRRFVD